MLSRRSKRYWRRMFEGENGDYVKNLLTDGQWKPGGEPDTLAVKVVGTVMAVIIVLIGIGVIGFGFYWLLRWLW